MSEFFERRRTLIPTVASCDDMITFLKAELRFTRSIRRVAEKAANELNRMPLIEFIENQGKPREAADTAGAAPGEMPRASGVSVAQAAALADAEREKPSGFIGKVRGVSLNMPMRDETGTWSRCTKCDGDYDAPLLPPAEGAPCHWHHDDVVRWKSAPGDTETQSDVIDVEFKNDETEAQKDQVNAEDVLGRPRGEFPGYHPVTPERDAMGDWARCHDCQGDYGHPTGRPSPNCHRSRMAVTRDIAEAPAGVPGDDELEAGTLDPVPTVPRPKRKTKRQMAEETSRPGFNA